MRLTEEIMGGPEPNNLDSITPWPIPSSTLLVQSGSIYNNGVCTHIAAADANYINMITPGYSMTTGF